MNVTLITGTTSGIGEALAHQLAAKKHNLLLVARTEKKLKEQSQYLSSQFGIVADFIVADLGKPGGAFYVYEQAKKKNLNVNILVNNAGIGSSGEFVTNNLQSELELLQLNNSSLVALCSLFLADMKSTGSGTIINVGSMASFFPIPYMSVYAASKMFVRSFTQALTEECKPYGIKVMLFCPGFTSTNFMNTSANNNAWGKILTQGAIEQTPEQVAVQVIKALERRKSIHVSGFQNAMSAKLGSLIPSTTLARVFAQRKRKEMGL
ncbi:SDR family NAD(P)-dependent oxidoreductase [Algoriphagus litoralis]|uniref:SDR family NAD(P)-dependent oxidoreductase n=1 Tax=Algoriphagus litoralis TaxID=2202829 RepID=UPI0013004E33|nr:SDR family NAD(P)-dependent oxidoreductase [Algoriphagus litoralis]